MKSKKILYSPCFPSIFRTLGSSGTISSPTQFLLRLDPWGLFHPSLCSLFSSKNGFGIFSFLGYCFWQISAKVKKWLFIVMVTLTGSPSLAFLHLSHTQASNVKLIAFELLKMWQDLFSSFNPQRWDRITKSNEFYYHQ